MDGKEKWTPGPWRLSPASPSGFRHISGAHWGRLASVVTKMTGDENEFPPGVANARLIAAAPDLYAALAELVVAETLDDGDPRLDAARAAARAALARARGEA